MRIALEEMAELRDPTHPRRRMSPLGLLEMGDVAVEQQRRDEEGAVEHCDRCVIPDGRGVGTPVGRPGPDPIDADLLDLDEPTPDLF